MTIDLRAKVKCNLGNVISAQINDDYIQGVGLIKTNGSCEIDGLISPEIGSPVTFQYTKRGLTRTIPRKLRVLSSFADPFRRKTSVELGCKLTYLADIREPIKWDQYDDPENEEEDPESEIPTSVIYARSVAYECLAKLGITASSMPLTNTFSIEEFDFSSGYVNILSDLLVSESYAGYLDANEVLQIFSLAREPSGGPVINEAKIVDIGGINSGQLPGDSVVVSYNTLKLKNSSEEGTEMTEEEILGEEEEEEIDPEDGNAAGVGTAPRRYQTSNTSSVSEITVGYKVRDLVEDEDGPLQFAAYTNGQYVYEESLFGRRTILDDNGERTEANLLVQRINRENKTNVSVAGGFLTERLKYGQSWGASLIQSESIEQFWHDNKGRETYYTLRRTEDKLFGAGNISLPTAFEVEDDDGNISVSFVPVPSGSYVAEEIRKSTSIYEGLNYGFEGGPVKVVYTKTITSKYGPWIETIQGQQAMARLRESELTADEVSTFIGSALDGSYLLETTIEMSDSGPVSQSAPSAATQVLEENSEEGEEEPSEDPVDGSGNNGFSTENKAELALALGSPTAVRIIELSMPYAPDDRFTKFGIGEDVTYYSFRSDANSKAILFGRVQNRMLLGNRYGMNIQLQPEHMPSAPYSSFYVVTDGIAGKYLTNGTSWTIDATGIIASTDGMYWGVAGKTS